MDVAIYHTTGANPQVPVVPDAFLSLGVERKQPAAEQQRLDWRAIASNVVQTVEARVQGVIGRKRFKIGTCLNCYTIS